MSKADEKQQLLHCAIAASDWLADGCDVHDIPRPHIAALVAFVKEAAQPDDKAQPPAEQGAELSDMTILAITTAYEQGVGKGHQAHKSGNEIANPYAIGKWRCDLAWQLGYEEGKEQADRAARGEKK